MVLVGTVASCTVGTRPTSEPAFPHEVTVVTETLEVDSAPRPEDATATSTDVEQAAATSTHDQMSDADDQDPSPEAASNPERTLRRLESSELNTALVAKASELIHEYRDQPFGTEIPFEVDGREYVGPCSLFVVENAS